MLGALCHSLQPVSWPALGSEEHNRRLRQLRICVLDYAATSPEELKELYAMEPHAQPLPTFLAALDKTSMEELPTDAGRVVLESVCRCLKVL